MFVKIYVRKKKYDVGGQRNVCENLHKKKKYDVGKATLNELRRICEYN